MCSSIWWWRHKWCHLTILTEFLIIFPKCVLCKATISCMTLPPKNVCRQVRIPEHENKYFKKTVWRHKWRHRGCKKYQKIFFWRVFIIANFFFNHVNRVTKKIIEGGSKLTHPGNRLTKKDLGRRGVNIKSIRPGLSPPTATRWPSGDIIHFIGWRSRVEI